MRLNNISVTKKFGMLTVSAFLAIFLISALQLMTYRQTMLEDRKAKTQNVVELAHSMTLDFMAQYKKGLLTEAQAKEEALSAIRAMRYDGDNYFWINDMQPRMVMHPMKPELVGTDLSKNADPNGKFLFNEMVEIVRKQGSGFVDYMWPKPGFDEPVGKLSYVAGVPEWGWVIGSGIYIDDVQTAFMQSVKTTALIAGGVFFLLFCSSWLISRSITLPLTRLSGNMGTLAEGRSITILDHQRGDEIGTMAKALQYLDVKLQEARQLEEQQRELEKRAEQEKKESIRRMADAFEEKVGGLIYSLASASSELQTTAQDMRNVADTTAQNSQMGAAASEQVRANVSSVATAMEEMAASSSEITAQINNTRIRSNDTAQNAGKANDTVTDLNVLVGDIGEVVAAIRDIAEQTNLLALNATIEAARAGESGKGFAVVADEVKKLATETSKKTGEIEAQINGIQQATGSSVIAMQQIIANISEIDQAITTVSSAAEEQNATNNEISRSITEASMGVQNVAQIIIEVQSGSDNTGASADAVLTAASELAELSEQLRTSLDVFLKDMRAG